MCLTNILRRDMTEWLSPEPMEIDSYSEQANFRETEYETHQYQHQWLFPIK